MLDRIPLGYYAFAGLLNFVTSFALLIFVFSKNPKSRINQAFCLFAFSVAGWGLSYLLWLTTDKSNLAEIYLRTLMLFVIFIPTTFTHFVLSLLKIDHKKINLGNYLISTLLGFTVYTQLFAHDIGPFLVFPYWLKPRFLFYVHAVHFFANVIYSHYLMLRALRYRAGVSRNQVLYVLMGTAIGYSGGALNYLTWSRIPVPPFLNPLVSVYVATVAYAIVRHRLMDIEVVIKKAVVFTSLLLAVFAVFVGITMTAQELIAGGRLWGLVISSVLIVLILRPLEIFLVNATDKYLFQKKYNPLNMIHDFSQAVLTELDLSKIAKQTVDILSEALRIESCGVFIPSKEGDKFLLKESRGVDNKEIFIDDKSPIISAIGASAVVMDQTDEMKQLGAVICVGILIRKNLIGVLALGRKKSDEDYTPDDIGVLNILADALGVAITNAVAYEELRHKANLVTIGTLASGIKHDISKPIDHMNAEASDILARLKKREYKDPAQMLDEAGNIIEKCCDTFQTVISISEKYASRPKESEKRVVLNIAEEVDTALSVVQHRINKSEIKVRKQIPDNLPKINFDKDYLRQILDNILGNAIDAIEAANRSKEDAVISIRAGEVANRTLNVRLEISDTGTGVPDKIKDKIFKSWFTTKGEKGTGLGLALVSELVMRGGGTVELESQEDKGATFILGFKGVR